MRTDGGGGEEIDRQNGLKSCRGNPDCTETPWPKREAYFFCPLTNPSLRDYDRYEGHTERRSNKTGIVYRVLRLLPPLRSTVRIAAVGRTIFFVGRFWNANPPWSLPELIILTLSYGVLLIIIREMSRDDWASARPAVKRLIPRQVTQMPLWRLISRD